MFYIGGAGKKKAVREILTIKEKSDIVEQAEQGRERSRSRSRSRSRLSHVSGDVVDDDTDDDDDDDDDHDDIPDVESETSNDPDHNDYITTTGNINTAGQHHHYSFTEEELDYDIEEFADQHPDMKEFQLVIYQINTNNTTPFLEFLFYYDTAAHCRLPYIHHNPKHNIRKETDGIMDKLFIGKYRFKGFFQDELTDKCFVFYEKYFVAASAMPGPNAALISLKKSHNWFWVCTTEIIYQRNYMTIPIDVDAIDFFLAYPTVGILQATLRSHRKHSTNTRADTRPNFHTVHIEAPTILYYGSNFCYAKNTALYGLKREPIIARYGPFYYFTTLEHSYYWACYHNAVVGSNKRETGNGGISRYAVFTKRMKTAFIDDDYDAAIVKKYTDRKNMFETKINEYRRTQEVYQPGVYDSIYSYDYSWTSSYDTLYNGYYNVNKILRPVWCVSDHRHFELLSYYEVDTDNIPAKYDPKYSDYTIM
jgi:hypothetical protein